jgi:hypothetical protein
MLLSGNPIYIYGQFSDKHLGTNFLKFSVLAVHCSAYFGSMLDLTNGDSLLPAAGLT